jgi:hypothetical protein
VVSSHQRGARGESCGYGKHQPGRAAAGGRATDPLGQAQRRADHRRGRGAVGTHTWKQYGISDRDFVALETAAGRISNYEIALVPGLLQTAEYTRAVFNSGRQTRREDWITNQLEVRLIRQERLTDEEHPLELDAVIHEFALRSPVGQPAIMRAQLQHLTLINELPTVTMRILPASTFSREAMYGGFSILDFPLPGQPSICHALHALGDIRQDKSEFVEPARLRFAHLRSLALEPEDSVALIERVVDELWSS